jgi:hypothetical protein
MHSDNRWIVLEGRLRRRRREIRASAELSIKLVEMTWRQIDACRRWQDRICEVARLEPEALASDTGRWVRPIGSRPPYGAG